MNKAALDNLSIPAALQNIKSITDWEDQLLVFFSGQYQLFTPYPDYFRLRTYEFRILRQLLPEYFNADCRYPSVLEIGCNFGFKSMLLSPYADHVLAVDIPDSYEGCHLGEFKCTTDIAKILVNGKMGFKNIEFQNMWPTELKVADAGTDLIFTEYVLEHIPDLPAAIKEMSRVLKKGGIMVHTVPSTKDATRVFIESNTKLTLKKMFKIAKAQVGDFLKGKTHNQAKLSANGMVIPPCHSEHIQDFSKQFDIYTLENYLFPMLENGFTIEKIVSTREHNHVIVARKR